MDGDDQDPAMPAEPPAADSTLELLDLTDQQRRALKYARMSVLRYVELIPLLALAGAAVLWVGGLFRGYYGGLPDLTGTIVVAALFVAGLTAVFLAERLSSAADLRSGQYARYTGPLRHQARKL